MIELAKIGETQLLNWAIPRELCILHGPVETTRKPS